MMLFCFRDLGQRPEVGKSVGMNNLKRIYYYLAANKLVSAHSAHWTIRINKRLGSAKPQTINTLWLFSRKCASFCFDQI
jgi:hypothetical protein